MRLFLPTAVFLAAATVGAQAPQSPQPPKGTAVIVGRVIDGNTGEPIANASVYWWNPDHAVASLPDGRFVLRGVPAGRLDVFVVKNGYLQGLMTWTRYGAAGVRLPLPLADGEIVTDVTLRLWRPASVSGRVVDEAGEPLVNVQMNATRQVLRAGRWTIGPASGEDATGRTDDRGIYRIDGLAPGRWLIGVHATSASVPTSVAKMLDTWMADPDRRQAASQFRSDLIANGAGSALPSQPTMTPAGNFLKNHGTLPTPTRESGFRYRTQFAGGAASAGAAQILELETGDERVGVDITLRPVRVVNISGTASKPDGPAAHVPLRLISNVDPENPNLPPIAVTISDASGQFTFLDVPPGEYKIRAVLPPARTFREVQVGSVIRIETTPPPPEAPTYWTEHEVAVGDRDVSNVTVALRRGVRVKGRVLFDGVETQELPPDFSRGELWLERADGTYSGFSWNLRTIPIKASAFASAEIPPGRYFLRSPYAWRIVSATMGGRDIMTSPIVVQEGRELPEIVVTMSKRFEKVSGTVTGYGPEGPEGSVVAVFPTDPARWTDYGSANLSNQFLVMLVTRSGAFEVPYLLPGEYYFIALSSDPGADWMDPRILKNLAPSAQRVTVTQASMSGLSLPIRLIPRKHSTPASSHDGEPSSGINAPEDTGSGPWVPEQQPASGTINGVVVLQEEGSKAPVRKAVVTLSCAEPRVQRLFVTDESGTFSFEDVPACRYSISAAKPAFVTINYGATRPDRPGTPLTLVAGQQANVTLTLLRGSVITGTIRTREGEPLPNAPVQVMRYGILNGQRQLQAVMVGPFQFSDRRGVYRVYGLPPGEYVVGAAAALPRSAPLTQITPRDVENALQAARTKQPMPDADQREPNLAGFATMFYPSTPNPAEAAVLKVGAGEERSGVDILMSPERLSRIRLTVTASNGQPPVTTQARVLLQQGYSGVISPASFATTTTAGGRVELAPLPPGAYSLAVSGTMQPQPSTDISRGGGLATGPDAIAFPEWAIVPFTVSGADQELTVRLERGKTITGRVVFDGANPPAAFKGVRIALSGPTTSGVPLQRDAQTVSADGTFALDSIVPAAYQVTAGPQPPKGWQIASAMINGQDAADRPVEILSDVADVIVTFTDKVAELTGRLETAQGRPATDYHVIVFAADRSYWTWGSRRSVSLRPGTDGTFRSTTLPAGEYLIAAVTDVDQNEWALPEFLETLVPAAVPLTLKLGARTEQILRIR